MKDRFGSTAVIRCSTRRAHLALVQSALLRPQNLAAYGQPDVAGVAAAYAFGLARNHGFVDGNKRTAFVVARVFLLDQGFGLKASGAERARIMVALALGDMEETALAGPARLTAGLIPIGFGPDSCEESKHFFFEKKKQKTFVHGASALGWRRSQYPKFFASFFQERRPFLLA